MQRKKTLKQKERELRQRRQMVKVPAVIKELINQDKQLQGDYMSTLINKGKYSKDTKDW